MFVIPEFVDVLTLAGRHCDSGKSFGKYHCFCVRMIVIRQLGDLLFPVCISCHIYHDLFSTPCHSFVFIENIVKSH